MHNLTTGEDDVASITLVDRTKHIDIEDNTIYNNARNAADELDMKWEIIVMHSDSIDFRNNTIRNDAYTPRTSEYNTFVINNSRNIGMYDSNSIQGGAYDPADVITRNSATWLVGER